MTTLQETARRLNLAWSPAHTTVTIVALAVAIGFLPFVKMGLVVNGVFVGAIIALGAIGLTLIYGILNFANVAHGDSMTMGAYIALFLVGYLLPKLGIESAGLGPFSFGYPLLIAIPIAVAAVAAGAIILDVAIYRRLREKGVNSAVLAMASLGLAIAIRGLVQLIWTGETQRLPRESPPGLPPANGCTYSPGRYIHSHRNHHLGHRRVRRLDSYQDGQGHEGYRGQSGPGAR